MDTDALQLRVYGFSGAKALEISLDAQRGDWIASDVLKKAKRKCHMIVEAYTRGYSPSRIAREENVSDARVILFISMMQLAMKQISDGLRVMSCERV